jgi:hypothetical protein
MGNHIIDKLIPGNLYYITCSFEHYQAFEKFNNEAYVKNYSTKRQIYMFLDYEIRNVGYIDGVFKEVYLKLFSPKDKKIYIVLYKSLTNDSIKNID